MINHGDLEEYVNGYFICLSLLFCSWFLYYIAKKILRQADKVGDTIQHVRVQRKRWYDDALFQDESTPPDDAPAWTISSSYNRDSRTREGGGGSGSGRQNEQEGGSGSGRIQREGGSGSGRVQQEGGSGSGRQDERDIGSGSGSGQRESGGRSGLINQNEEERGGGSGGNRRLLVEGSGQTEEPRRDKGKGTGISSISNILNP